MTTIVRRVKPYSPSMIHAHNRGWWESQLPDYPHMCLIPVASLKPHLESDRPNISIGWHKNRGIRLWAFTNESDRDWILENYPTALKVEDRRPPTAPVEPAANQDETDTPPQEETSDQS